MLISKYMGILKKMLVKTSAVLALCSLMVAASNPAMADYIYKEYYVSIMKWLCQIEDGKLTKRFMA